MEEEGGGRRTLDVTSGVWHGLSELAARISSLAQAQGLGPCPLSVSTSTNTTPTSPTSLTPRPEVQPQGGQVLHLLWQHWMPRSGYPHGVAGGLPALAMAPAAGNDGGGGGDDGGGSAGVSGDASVAVGSGVEESVGLGWISMDAGLTDLIRYHALNGSSAQGAVHECNAE